MINRPLLVVSLAFMLSACSDDGDSSDEVVVVHANPAGVWTGCLTTMLEREDHGLLEEEFDCDEPFSPGQHRLLVVADEKGHFRAFGQMGVSAGDTESGSPRYLWNDDPFLARGRVVADENETQGYWDLFIRNPTVTTPENLGPQEYRSVTSEGELTTRDRWAGKIDVSGLTMFQFALAYDEAQSLRGASIDQLASVGVWQDLDEGKEVTLLFHADGSFTTDEASSGPCLYRGRVSVPDPGLNLYRFSDVVISHGNEVCAIPGVGEEGDISIVGPYGGIGTLVEEDGEILKVSFSNEVRIVTLNLRRN